MTYLSRNAEGTKGNYRLNKTTSNKLRSYENSQNTMQISNSNHFPIACTSLHHFFLLTSHKMNDGQVICIGCITGINCD